MRLKEAKELLHFTFCNNTMAAAFLSSHLLTNLSSSSPLLFHPNPHFAPHVVSINLPSRNRTPNLSKSLTVPSALAESDSPKSIEPDSKSLLQELAKSFDLPSDYFVQLPRDLRLDLNDAAFDLSNGPVVDECGEELGGILSNLSRAWEKADSSTSRALASRLPQLESSLTNNSKSALGRRLVSAGRRFQSMGQFGDGELAKIAKAMIAAGKSLTAVEVSEEPTEPKVESRMFKFGELQVEITSDKANIGAAIALAFGVLSWGLTQGVQNVPESSLQYANDNALLLAKSLRGALLTIGYGSTLLSAFSSVGLLLLAQQLKSEGK